MSMEALDTGTEDLLAHVEDGVAVITMNRPERRNAFSPAMIRALGTVLAAVEADDAVGAVVLTGASGAFSAGGDVKMMAGGEQLFDPDATHDQLVHMQQLSQRATSVRLWQMAKPTIAALPGPAAGAGFALALACDLRYAADTALLTTAFVRVGFSGDYAGTWLLTRLVGSAKAKELYFFSERVSAAEAETLGLVNAVFPAAVLMNEVMTRARRLANGPRVALRFMKENLNRAVHGDLADCSDLEVTHHAQTATTQDHREAAIAFVEKREPVFHGR
jgi:2-(1,2-epoxy-1,2-dihydrophenyl)acetyl-CoA isomerase